MMLCPWCDGRTILPDKPIVVHLVILEFDDGTAHVHYPAGDDPAIMRLLTYLGNERQKEDDGNLSSLSPEESD